MWERVSVHLEIGFVLVLRSLPAEEIDRMICLAQVLNQIDCPNEAFEAKSVDRAMKYLEHRLEDLNWNRLPPEVSGIASDTWGNRDLIFSLCREMLPLSLNRKRELIKLGRFLKGEVFTSGETDSLKKILRSYLETMQYYKR
jgi:hypothetical protein